LVKILLPQKLTWDIFYPWP